MVARRQYLKELGSSFGTDDLHDYFNGRPKKHTTTLILAVSHIHKRSNDSFEDVGHYFVVVEVVCITFHSKFELETFSDFATVATSTMVLGGTILPPCDQLGIKRGSHMSFKFKCARKMRFSEIESGALSSRFRPSQQNLVFAARVGFTRAPPYIPRRRPSHHPGPRLMLVRFLASLARPIY
jgi:hypothetical protein